MQDGSHMAATADEVFDSRLECCLEYLKAGTQPQPRHWAGYHPRAYWQAYNRAPRMAELRACLEQQDPTTMPLDMQVWCRDNVPAPPEPDLVALEVLVQPRDALVRIQAHTRPDGTIAASFGEGIWFPLYARGGNQYVPTGEALLSIDGVKRQIGPIAEVVSFIYDVVDTAPNV